MWSWDLPGWSAGSASPAENDDAPVNRQALAAASVEHLARGQDVIVIANNKAEGSAPRTVFKLAGEIVSRLQTG